MRVSKGLTQAYQLQDVAFNVCKALADEMQDANGKIVIRRDEYGKPVDAPAIAQLIKSWESAQQRISFHRRVPSPGVLKPEASGSKRKRPQRASGSIALLPAADDDSLIGETSPANEAQQSH